MTKKQIEAMVRDIVSAADYDLGKCLDTETAEEPEYVEADLAKLVAVARKHLPQSKAIPAKLSPRYHRGKKSPSKRSRK